MLELVIPTSVEICAKMLQDRIGQMDRYQAELICTYTGYISVSAFKSRQIGQQPLIVSEEKLWISRSYIKNYES